MTPSSSSWRPLGAAIVGCGNIAGRYADAIARAPELLRLVATYDVDPTRSAALAEAHGAQSHPTLEALLQDPSVDIVVNLTFHTQHAVVSTAALEAGKHVHSEKPLAGSLEEGRALVALAEARGLRLSCSPFTFLGEAQQAALGALNSGAIGRVLVAYSEMNWGRIERWHPDPAGFYGPGAGPLLDVGVYALTLLTALLGPIARVSGFARVIQPERTIASGPKAGQHFQVTTPDHVMAWLDFESGTVGRLTTNFLVRGTKQRATSELHGERGSLVINHNHDFHYPVELYDEASDSWTTVEPASAPFQGVDWGRALVDLAHSLRDGTPQRVTGRQALHVLETCLAILRSAEEGRPVEVESRFEIPPPL
jgi:predicted dehydrogenase